MILALSLVAGLALCLLIAHERAVWERNRRASEELRKRFPTDYGTRL
jgi:hypothetical protein